jgi:hypothetical protein
VFLCVGGGSGVRDSPGHTSSHTREAKTEAAHVKAASSQTTVQRQPLLKLPAHTSGWVREGGHRQCDTFWRIMALKESLCIAH